MEATSPKMFCFVLMPFNQEFDDIYALGIKESCKEAGAYCERVDEQNYQGSILDRIYNQISKADVVIADMTGKNPNVFYEVGYAHALNKPTILLTQNESDIPFDLKHYPHIIYEKKIVKLKDELTKKIRWFAGGESLENKKYKTEIDFYVDGKNLLAGDVVYEYEASDILEFEFMIHNVSPFTYEKDDFQVGVLIDFPVTFGFINSDLTRRIPGGKYLHMLRPFERLFPDAYASRSITLFDGFPRKFSIAFRLFSAAGSRDFPLTFTPKQQQHDDLPF